MGPGKANKYALFGFFSLCESMCALWLFLYCG